MVFYSVLWSFVNVWVCMRERDSIWILFFCFLFLLWKFGAMVLKFGFLFSVRFGFFFICLFDLSYGRAVLWYFRWAWVFKKSALHFCFSEFSTDRVVGFSKVQ